MTQFNANARRLHVALSTSILVGVLVLMTGCGPAAPPTHPVHGVILAPKSLRLQDGIVNLHHPSGDRTVRGIIQADHTFTVETIKPPHRLAGAEVGVYQIEVVPPMSADQKMPAITVKTTEVQVKPDVQNKFEIVVESKPN